MTRDVNRLRGLLLALEASESELVLTDAADIEHGRLLSEAGFVEAVERDVFKFQRIALTRLTWKGHEFLDAVRDAAVWASVVGEVGPAAPVDIVEAIARELVHDRVKQMADSRLTTMTS